MWFERGFISAKEFIDRGDVDGYDFNTGNFTKDGTWRPLGFTSVVGVRSVLVLVKLQFQVLQTNRAIKFRTGGFDNEVNIIQTRGTASNIPVVQDFWIMTDEYGEIRYYITTGSYAYFDMLVRGWYE